MLLSLNPILKSLLFILPRILARKRPWRKELLSIKLYKQDKNICGRLCHRIIVVYWLFGWTFEPPLPPPSNWPSLCGLHRENLLECFVDEDESSKLFLATDRSNIVSSYRSIVFVFVYVYLYLYFYVCYAVVPFHFFLETFPSYWAYFLVAWSAFVFFVHRDRTNLYSRKLLKKRRWRKELLSIKLYI